MNKSILILALFGISVYIITKNSNNTPINGNRQALKNFFLNNISNENLKNILVSKVSQFNESEVNTLYHFWVVNNGECNNSSLPNCENVIVEIFTKYSLNQYFYS